MQFNYWISCLFSSLFIRVLKNNSTGAYSGAYGDKKTVRHNCLFKYPIHFLALCRGQLSRRRIILSIGKCKSILIYLTSFLTNSTKMVELFLPSKWFVNHSLSEVIAQINERGPTNEILLMNEFSPLQLQE